MTGPGHPITIQEPSIQEPSRKERTYPKTLAHLIIRHQPTRAAKHPKRPPPHATTIVISSLTGHNHKPQTFVVYILSIGWFCVVLNAFGFYGMPSGSMPSLLKGFLSSFAMSSYMSGFLSLNKYRWASLLSWLVQSQLQNESDELFCVGLPTDIPQAL